MLDIASLSSHYKIRRLDDSDVEEILNLCRNNTQFYQFCEAEASKEQVLNDLHTTPPGIAVTDKYYMGFYQEETLLALMDMIDGYPERDIAYIGFFMMNKEFQGRGIGTAIIQEALEYLKTIGKTSVMLGIDKENPQSNHFWKKNDFIIIKEVDRDGWTVLVAEAML